MFRSVTFLPIELNTLDSSNGSHTEVQGPLLVLGLSLSRLDKVLVYFGFRPGEDLLNSTNLVTFWFSPGLHFFFLPVLIQV